MTETVYIKAKNTQRTEHLYAVLSKDKNGNEGICSMGMPLVSDNPIRIQMFSDAITELKKIAEENGDTEHTFHLVQFKRVGEIKEQF